MSKEQSWERIFELELLRKSPLWNNCEHVLQGVTGKIGIDKVKKIKEFRDRGFKI